MSVLDESKRGMKNWGNGNEKGQPQYSEKNLSLHYSVPATHTHPPPKKKESGRGREIDLAQD